MKKYTVNADSYLEMMKSRQFRFVPQKKGNLPEVSEQVKIILPNEKNAYYLICECLGGDVDVNMCILIILEAWKNGVCYLRNKELKGGLF